MNTSQNPYTRLMLTYHADYFYGRSDEISTILQVISAPEPTSHAIYGIRTIGKTTLLKYLKDPQGALQDYHAFVHSDYQFGSGKRLYFIYLNFHLFTPDDDLFYLLISGLEEGLNDDDSPFPEFVFPDYYLQMGKQDIHHILRDTLRLLNDMGVRIVFLLDDFDAVILKLHAEDDHLLHSLSQITPFVIATEKPFPELRPEMMDTSPLLGILRPETLGLLSDDSARRLIIDPAHQVDVTYSEDEITFLIGIGGRHPFLLVSTCECYFNTRREFPDFPKMLANTEKYSEPQEYIVSKLLVSPHVRTVLQRTWATLSIEEQHILLMIARGEKKPKLPEEIGIAGRLVNKALAELDFQLPIGRTYRCTILVKEFLTRHTTQQPKVVQHTIETTMQKLSEHLSPIDRKVFNHLLKRPNQICTFEDLLNDVWIDGDGSKRALEASIHRLRRHLTPGEEIRNIRGRGYKYVMIHPAKSNP